MRISVFQRRFLLVTLILLAAIAFGGWFVYQTYARLNRQVLERSALFLGHAVEISLHNPADHNLDNLTEKEKERLRELMHTMTAPGSSVLHILLINKNKRILLSSDPVVEGRRYIRKEEASQLDISKPVVTRKNFGGNGAILDVIIPLKTNDQQAIGYLRLVLSQTRLLTFYADIFKVFLPITAVLIALLVFFFYFLSRTYQAPLHNIRQLADRLDEGDFSFRIDYRSNDEFTSTFRALNQSLEKMDMLTASYKKSEKQIQALLDAVKDGIILLDSGLRVISMNDTIQRMLGEGRPDILFRRLLENNPDLRGLLQRMIRLRHPRHESEMSLMLNDGNTALSRVALQFYEDDAGGSSVLMNLRNVESYNELQSNLQRSMKFGVIANLAASIGHEIRNPLSSMAIHAEILNKRVAETSEAGDDKIRRSAEVLQREVQRLNRIISQFLNLARVQKGELTLLNLNALIRDVVVLVQQQSIERSIEITTSLNDSIDFIYGEADQLKQVLLNLVLNAFQAIGKDGLVTISTRRDDRRCFVEVTDNGLGMDEETKKRIFELYFTTKSDGAGIGLAVSRNIMEAHEGSILFESAPGQGTRFILDFPNKDQSTQIGLSKTDR